MPAFTRLGDCTSCAGVAIQASSDVFSDGIQVHRLTDLDTCGVCVPPAVAPIVQASPTTYANGLPVARIGDPDACVGVMVCGSSTVFADGM